MEDSDIFAPKPFATVVAVSEEPHVYDPPPGVPVSDTVPVSHVAVPFAPPLSGAVHDELNV